MRALLAAAPLLAVILGLLVGRSARGAALFGLAVTAGVMALAFPVSGGTLARAGVDWGPVVLEVVLVVGGGILFAEAGRATGNQDALTRWITRSLGTGIVPVLAIVHGFTPLTESLTGYGIGTALAIPLLLGIGVPGRKAALIGLLGLCAVPWGSMGPGTLIASHLTGVGFAELGVTTAIFNFAVVAAAGVAAALLVSPRGARLAHVAAGLGSAALLGGGILGANLLVGTAPAGAIGGLLTLAAHIALRALRGHRIRVTRELGRAALPYGVVLGGVLCVSLVVQANGAAGAPWATVAGSPATWLFAATGFLLTVRPGFAREVLRETAQTWVRVAPATVLFIALGALMGVSGMSTELAAQLARLGSAYLFLLPLCAALIGFITGSNSGANALGAGAQADVARALGADVPLAIGAHNAAGAAAMMASPARVELATRLARVPADSRSVQRTLLLVLACSVTLMGALSLALR